MTAGSLFSASVEFASSAEIHLSRVGVELGLSSTRARAATGYRAGGVVIIEWDTSRGCAHGEVRMIVSSFVMAVATDCL